MIGILIPWVMSRSITRPLNKLTAAAMAIASGDRSSPVHVNRNDELGKLAHAFNTMTTHVEKKVEQRTAQLQTANMLINYSAFSNGCTVRKILKVPV